MYLSQIHGGGPNDVSLSSMGAAGCEDLLPMWEMPVNG